VADPDQLLERFEEQRTRLRAIAYRMLGSVSEADDAVQESWLRASRAGSSGVDNVAGWLTTIVTRVCLNLLRSRERRREESLDTAVRVPDPLIGRPDRLDPEHEALLSDSVGLALMVVLEELTPAERIAFVLHDIFAVPFDEIAVMIERTPAATRQLASRARRRVQGQAPTPDPDVAKQQEVVDAFLAASRAGDFDALVRILDPDVVLHADGGTRRARQSVVVHGAEAVAGQAVLAQRIAPFARPALVNGAAGLVAVAAGRVLAVMSFTVTAERIAAMEILVDPDRLAELDVTVLDAGDG
jgi:RNA polymerase sigma factor (sigma-70 family)